MLFLLNSLRKTNIEEIKSLGCDEDKSVLLVGDAVYLGIPGMASTWEDLGVEEVFAASDAVSARGLTLDAAIASVGYDGWPS
ncbi:MAG: DsrH/TusB family sulfur metabolism protein [Solidesulfovibrio sp.]